MNETQMRTEVYFWKKELVGISGGDPDVLYAVAKCPGESTCTLRNRLPKINKVCILFMAGFLLMEDAHVPGKINLVAHKCVYFGFMTMANLCVNQITDRWLQKWLYAIITEHAHHCLSPTWYAAYRAVTRDPADKARLSHALYSMYEEYALLVRTSETEYEMLSDVFLEMVSTNVPRNPVFVTLSMRSSRETRPPEPPARRRPKCQIDQLLGAVHAVRDAGRMMITMEVTPGEMYDLVRCLAVRLSPAGADERTLYEKERVLLKEYGLADANDFEAAIAKAVALAGDDEAERQRCERVGRFVAGWTDFCNRLQTPRTVSFRMDDVTELENDPVRFVFTYSLPGEMEGVGCISVVYTVDDPWPRNVAAMLQMKNPFVFEESRLQEIAFPGQLSHTLCNHRHTTGVPHVAGTPPPLKDVCPMSAWTSMVCDYLEHPACTVRSVDMSRTFSDSCPMSPYPCKRSVPTFRVLDALAQNRSVCKVERVQLTDEIDYTSMCNMLSCNKSVHTLSDLRAINLDYRARRLSLLNEAMRDSNTTLRWIGDDRGRDFYFIKTTDLCSYGRMVFADFVRLITRNNSIANDVHLFLSVAGDNPSDWMVGPPPLQSIPTHVRAVRLLDAVLRNPHGYLFQELASRMDAPRIARLRNAIRTWYFRLTHVCIASHLDVASEQLWADIFRFLSITDIIH